jgi:hypothetical protein
MGLTAEGNEKMTRETSSGHEKRSWDMGEEKVSYKEGKKGLILRKI